MSIFVDAIIFILTSYLAFTNTLATLISDILPNEEPVTLSEEVEANMVELPSILKQSIPDILLRNSDYQNAALGAAVGLTGTTANDPIEALVNIFCTFKTKDYIRTTTGSGFFIDPDGVIMTNAHIAQFLLLEKTDSFGQAQCIVRTGSPAASKYTADLLYLPPTWIQENAELINDSAPMGTGERDYALLYVSGTVDNEPLPAVFPALSFDSDLLPVSTKDASVTAAGYPAHDLIENGASTDLLARKAITSISELYTFGSNYADVFSVRGSAIGAEGSSGGPIINEDGEVIGMIATRGDDDTDGAGSLRAITLSHVNRTIKEETGFSLAENLNGNLSYRSEIFANTMTPFLIELLEDGRDS
ncbi:MAG: trypsin-like peptidase domain-containing protein [Candidatus Pacebacteria bacterium]|nr:trypsin-like peptidase domain-containing protein [Candidatus Paceibacterota bacterium]MBP9843269.1 trypsin-like peptidase domain-containing protein [Candidatus Paceibacterota bacterium]